jgi:hypothetical protein
MLAVTVSDVTMVLAVSYDTCLWEMSLIVIRNRTTRKSRTINQLLLGTIDASNACLDWRERQTTLLLYNNSTYEAFLLFASIIYYNSQSFRLCMITAKWYLSKL